MGSGRWVDSAGDRHAAELGVSVEVRPSVDDLGGLLGELDAAAAGQQECSKLQEVGSRVMAEGRRPTNTGFQARELLSLPSCENGTGL